MVIGVELWRERRDFMCPLNRVLGIFFELQQISFATILE